MADTLLIPLAMKWMWWVVGCGLAACQPAQSGESRTFDPAYGGDAGAGYTPPSNPSPGTVPMQPTPAAPDFMGCSAVSAEALPTTLPVDIVWVIDASGSMSREAGIVQSTLSDFVSRLDTAGIDARVTVISEGGFVSVPPPLGTDATRFRYIPTEIDSDNSLVQTIATYPVWSTFLRPEGQLHIVEITDSDSEDMGPGEFMTQMQALLGTKTYTYHAIVSPPGSRNNFILPGDGCELPGVRQATNNGDEYWAVSQATGGLQISICTDDWTMVFDQLFTAAVAPAAIPCEYEIPPPPAGMVIDRNQMNVQFTPATGSSAVLPFVPTGAAGCAGQGWHFDEDKVVLCPSSCTAAGIGGRVDIAFGCATVVI